MLVLSPQRAGELECRGVNYAVSQGQLLVETHLGRNEGQIRFERYNNGLLHVRNREQCAFLADLNQKLLEDLTL